MSKFKRQQVKSQKSKPKCGLCGKSSKPLIKTECCGNLICDDWNNYQMFSFAHNSCSRNHDRYTICSSHFNEGHKGDWRECEKCKEGWETEMYVYYGTNEYNFIKLENPPHYEPTHCSKCNCVIDLGYDGYMKSSEGYFCDKCSAEKYSDLRKVMNL
jgi:hypothetical protein